MDLKELKYFQVSVLEPVKGSRKVKAALNRREYIRKVMRGQLTSYKCTKKSNENICICFFDTAFSINAVLLVYLITERG